jgi:Trypsin
MELPMLPKYRIVLLSFLVPTVAVHCEDRVMAPIPSGNEANIQIIGGKPATREDWPSTLLFDGNVGRCTSTIVGTYAVLTAGHCVDNNSPAKLLWDNRRTDLLCHVHPDYRGQACENEFVPQKLVGCTADVAICIAAKPISTGPGKFERVRTSPPAISAKDQINLLGYGCTQANGKISQVLQIGSAAVERPAQPGASQNPSDTMNEFIKTSGAAVCSGDSGGASYSPDKSKPEMLAIASRGNLSRDSYLVDLRTSQIQKFLQEAKQFRDFGLPPGSIKICGIDSDAENCR